MHLGEASLDRLSTWLDGPDCREGDRERVLELLRGLKDGSWRSRWYISHDRAPENAAERCLVYLRRDLLFVLDLHADGVPEQVDVIAILDFA